MALKKVPPSYGTDAFGQNVDSFIVTYPTLPRNQQGYTDGGFSPRKTKQDKTKTAKQNEGREGLSASSEADMSSGTAVLQRWHLSMKGPAARLPGLPVRVRGDGGARL